MDISNNFLILWRDIKPKEYYVLCGKDWCGIRWGSKNKHHKDTCSKEIGLRFQIELTTPLNSEHNWEDLYI